MENSQSAVIHVTDDDFEAQVINSDVPVLLDFWAPWCGPCKALNPVIEDLAVDFKDRAKIVKVDVDQSPETAKRFGVRGIPHVLMVVGGEAVADVGKIRTKASLSTVINGYVAGKESDDVLEENLSDLTLREEFLLSGDAERVRAFLKDNPQYVNEPLGHGQPPITAAIMNKQAERVALLLEFDPEMGVAEMAGAGCADALAARLKDNPKLANEPAGGRTPPLWFAIRGGHTACMDVLVEAGADVNWGMADDHRPLLLEAGYAGRADVMRHLVSKGMDVHTPIGRGETILHFTSFLDNADMVGCLLEQGLDPEAKDDKGTTPIEIAKEQAAKDPDHHAIVTLLKAHRRQ